VLFGELSLTAGCMRDYFPWCLDRAKLSDRALLRHPAIRAAGFTGSRLGGVSLMRVAAQRPEAIPVYAEMSSINPIFLFPQALEKDGTTGEKLEFSGFSLSHLEGRVYVSSCLAAIRESV
jgi:acyl-CoA reductase-like NAD-dependent aldehyde dehydrogenase